MKRLAVLFLFAGVLLISSPLFAQPFKPGEKITYQVEKISVPAGTATVEFKGEKDIGGRKALLIVFTADGPKFYDQEMIYVDPESFQPVHVDRDVNIFGKKEKITEEYDLKKGSVKITKIAGGKMTTQVIEKGQALDNIYGFIYKYRLKGSFKIGDSFNLNLPTKDVKIKLIKQYDISAGGKNYNTFLMQSEPRRYNVWFDSSPQRIPVRIDGGVGFGRTTMVLQKIETSP